MRRFVARVNFSCTLIGKRPQSLVILSNGININKIVLINSQGQIISQETKPMLTTKIDIRNLKKGIYFVLFHTEGCVQSEKLIVE